MEWGRQWREVTLEGLLESWEWDWRTGNWGTEEQVKICRHPTCLQGRSSLRINRRAWWGEDRLEESSRSGWKRKVSKRYSVGFRGDVDGGEWSKRLQQAGILFLSWGWEWRVVLREEVGKVSVFLTCFPGPFSWCVCRECLLGLKPGIRGWIGGRKVGGNLCHTLGMGSKKKERLQQVFCYREED